MEVAPKKGPPTRSEFSGLTLEVRGLGAKVEGLGAKVEGLGAKVEGLGAKVEELGATVEELGARMDQNTGVLRQILRAVEAGTERRDTRVDAIEGRVRRLEEHSGLEPPTPG